MTIDWTSTQTLMNDALAVSTSAEDRVIGRELLATLQQAGAKYDKAMAASIGTSTIGAAIDAIDAEYSEKFAAWQPTAEDIWARTANAIGSALTFDASDPGPLLLAIQAAILTASAAMQSVLTDYKTELGKVFDERPKELSASSCHGALRDAVQAGVDLQAVIDSCNAWMAL